MHEIKKLPFYVVGQRKDSHRTIAGLFATGNSSGCRFGSQYTTSLPGQSISIDRTLGREVGRYVASL